MKYYKYILKIVLLSLSLSSVFAQKIVHMNGTYDLDGDNMLEFLLWYTVIYTVIGVTNAVGIM